MQITGTGFGAVTEVRFGGLPASFEVVSPTMITAVSPPATTGAVEVSVVTPTGHSGATRRARFTYERPTVTHVTPDAGPMSGGTETTVTGSGFSTATGGTTFKVGKGTAVTVQCPSTSECTIRTPSASRAGVAYVFAAAGGKKSKKATTAQFDYESAGAVRRRLLTGVAPVTLAR